VTLNNSDGAAERGVGTLGNCYHEERIWNSVAALARPSGRSTSASSCDGEADAQMHISSKCLLTSC